MAQRSLKVDCGGDIRRITVSWGAQASHSEIYSNVLAAIQTAFSEDESVVRNAVLRYKDDEGDQCTLTQHTLHDFVALSDGGVLRLSMQLAAETRADTVDEAMPQAQGVSAMEVEPQPSSAAAAPPCASPFAPVLMALLPVAAQHVQVKKADLNTLAMCKRLTLLPLCQRLVELAGRVPESQHLVPQLEAFVSGTDTAHFGDTAAALLQAWANSQSKEAVQQALPVVMQELMAAGPSLRSGGLEMGGFPFVPPGREGGAPSCSSGGAPDFSSLLGGLFAGKGGGKGNPLGFIANALAAKGIGRGAGGAPAWAPSAPAAPSAPPPPSPQQQQQDPGDCSSAAMAAQLEASIAELAEMGLVPDADAARNLLLAHGGDITQVVAALCPDS